MTTLLSSDRDHAIDRLAASSPELVVRCITDFAEDTISLATAPRSTFLARSHGLPFAFAVACRSRRVMSSPHA